MADNFLERQYAEYERKKAEAQCPGKKKLKPLDKKRFFTRPVVTKTHEERQREIEKMRQTTSGPSVSDQE